jgi:hypothetical protein
MNLKAADMLVISGKPNEAKEIYQLLLHYGQEGAVAQMVKARLNCLERIDRGENRFSELNDMLHQLERVDPIVKFAGVQQAHPYVVTNLLSVAIDSFALEHNGSVLTIGTNSPGGARK